MPPQQASQYTLHKKLTEIHWLCYDNNVPSLNTVKILTVRFIKNFKFFYPPVFGLPAIRPTSTRSMAPEFSYNKGNLV